VPCRRTLSPSQTPDFARGINREWEWLANLQILVIAFWLDYGFAYLGTPDWWRIPLAIQIVPAAILAIGCWVWVPPSPRWLIQQDRHACAREVLARFHGDEVAEVEMREIAEMVAFEKVVSVATWKEMFTWPVLRVTLLGTGVQFFQQITGTNSIRKSMVSERVQLGILGRFG
jgi:hypothetical protein